MKPLDELNRHRVEGEANVVDGYHTCISILAVVDRFDQLNQEELRRLFSGVQQT
jgi:hypothetical protein